MNTNFFDDFLTGLADLDLCLCRLGIFFSIFYDFLIDAHHTSKNDAWGRPGGLLEHTSINIIYNLV